MSEHKRHMHKHIFIHDIVNALQIRMEDFMYNLFHGSPHEVRIYIWMDKLYQKGKSSEEAILLIHRASIWHQIKNLGASS